MMKATGSFLIGIFFAITLGLVLFSAQHAPPRDAYAQTVPLSGAGGTGSSNGRNCGIPGICYNNPLFTTGVADNTWSRTFMIGTGSIALTTSTPALVIEAGPIYTVRLKRLCVAAGIATTAAHGTATLQRMSGVSSAGTVITPTAADTLDGPPTGGGFTGVVRAGPSVTPAGVTQGTVDTISLFFASTAIAGETTPCRNFDDGVFKPIILRPGVTNGLQLLFPGQTGGTLANVEATLTEQLE